ncbi:Sigma-54 interaction domain-containing protein [Desulfonema limicola]|uniref:Sigma-54 interaction domain-containing protein n=1 Tax=Desulfonema limicola TaxID=45656 RepID=A0A975B5S1_9BACT|nr:sigma-54 dependent transcriptional regulator [Desulfonema limicola]QTA79328.1 Sigma-54 interaction domain-containing protein [Desulfonema limicola]
MKNIKNSTYHISLYLIIPAIFAGFAVLSSILSFRLTQYTLNHNLDPGIHILWASVIISIIGLLFGFLIVWVILKPIRDFVKNAESVLPPETQDSTIKKPEGQLEEWNNVFKRVTTVLSMVDARQIFPEIIAESEIMRGLLAQINKVAPTDSTALITGESGTGKELVATSIFKQSKRNDKPFIKLNCVAIAKELWESELFGHEKGAFTGAVAQKPGKFELADKGTLFLDEIGDMPLETQAKMLRVLQEREFERVGGTRTIKVDVRFIAATNKNLEEMVSQGTFREDLYFRLNVVNLNVPPLRERKEDIPLLVQHFCKKAPKKIQISPVALQLLMENSSWPGNIRELQNTIERASVMCESGVIESEHLPDNIVGSGFIPPSLSFAESDPENNKNNFSLNEHLAMAEKNIIIEALRKTSGVQSKASIMLGINQRSLWHRIKKYEIDTSVFK